MWQRGSPILLREDLVLKPVSAYVWQGVKDAKGANEFGKVIVRRRYDKWKAVDMKPGGRACPDSSGSLTCLEVRGQALTIQ